MKKLIAKIMIFLIIITNINVMDLSESYANTNEDSGEIEELAIGVFYLWCHSDGTTWQRYKRQIAGPGRTIKNIDFQVVEKEGYIVDEIKPFVGGPKEFAEIDIIPQNMSYKTFETNYLNNSLSPRFYDLDPKAAVGRNDGIRIYFNELRIPTLNQKNENGKNEFRGKSVKKKWQNKFVQGWAIYFCEKVTYKPNPALVEKGIDVDFTCENEVYENQDINLLDKSSAWARFQGKALNTNEITREEIHIVQTDGEYNQTIERSSYYIRDNIQPRIALMEGTYDITLKGWDTANNTDSHTERVVVKKAEVEVETPAQVIAMEIAPSTAELNTPFPVTAENSFTNKGKIVKWKHYVSVGNMDNWTEIPADQGGEQEKFEFTGNQETDYYFKVDIETTEGITATSKPVMTSLYDNASASVDALIETEDIWYEGIYEYVDNDSTVDVSGASKDEYNGSWKVDSKIGKMYSSNVWKYFDLFEFPKAASRTYEREDWNSASGGMMRFNTVGDRELWLRVKGKGGAKDIDTRVVDVQALPKAVMDVQSSKKNREVTIINNSLFKPQNAWQNGENGTIDDTKTLIKITNKKTGEVATSIGGRAFNKSWVKGLATEFGVVDEDDYTHEKNDVTRVVFTGDYEHDQLTEIFEFEISVEDKRGNTDSISSIKPVYGDVKPFSRIDGLWNYIRNPFTKRASTELYETSFSKDEDDINTWTTSNGMNLPIDSKRKIAFETDKVGKTSVRNKVKERFISKVYSGLRRFLSSSDELEDIKDYTVNIDNIAPSASLEGLKTESINMINYVDADNDVSNQLNQLTQDMMNESVKLINTNFIYREDVGFAGENTNNIDNNELKEIIQKQGNNELLELYNDPVWPLYTSNENEIYKYFYFYENRYNWFTDPKDSNHDWREQLTHMYRYNKILDRIEKIGESNIRCWEQWEKTTDQIYGTYKDDTLIRIYFFEDKIFMMYLRGEGNIERGRHKIRKRYIHGKVYDYNYKFLSEQFGEISADRLEGDLINPGAFSSTMNSMNLMFYINRKKASTLTSTLSYDNETGKMSILNGYDVLRFIVSQNLISRRSPRRGTLDLIEIFEDGELKTKIDYALTEKLGDRKEWKNFVYITHEHGYRQYSDKYILDVTKSSEMINLGNKQLSDLDKIWGFEDDAVYVQNADGLYLCYLKKDPHMNNLIPFSRKDKEKVPKFKDNFYKLNELNNFVKADHNYITIYTNKNILFGNLETIQFKELLRGFNEKYGLSGNQKLKPLIVDIGGQNEESFRELVSSTSGIYLKPSNNIDAIEKVKAHLNAFAGAKKAKNSIRINNGDILEMNGSSIDYEEDQIILEQYRLRGQAWGAFGSSIRKLDGNKLQFNKNGSYVIEYQSKDRPPSSDGADYGKFSNTASLTVVVGDGEIPEPPKIPPTIDVKILSMDGENVGKERRRVDFIVQAHEGSSPINWNSLNVDFDKADYLPTKTENNFTTAKAFSRIFTTVGQHKVIVSLAGTDGTQGRVEIPFNITADAAPTGGFEIVGDAVRNYESGLAQFFIDNESASSPDGDQFEVSYFEEVTKYRFTDTGMVEDGLGWGELDVVGKMFETADRVKVRQLVKELYSNGTGLNNEDLDKDGYRVYKSHETIKDRSVVKKPPTMEYKAGPDIVLRGEGITHVTKIEDDTSELGKTKTYKFVHDASVLQNNRGTNPLNNSVKSEPLKQTDYKGLYHFYSKVTDEDNMSSDWVDGGTVKVVSKPIAAFEPFTNSTDSKGSNLEYEEDVFGKGSKVEFTNQAFNEDYGDTRQDKGIKSIKMEYRRFDEDSYTEFYHDDNISFYPNKFVLPSGASSENGLVEVKQTVVSVDGIESEITKNITILDFRLSGGLEPSTIYPSQTYKITAVTSSDALGAVAYIPYEFRWATLNKVKEENGSKYWEVEVSTVETMTDGLYPIELYGLYPYNLERRLDLQLEVDCGIQLKSNIRPVAPAEYSSVIDNEESKNKIKIPSGEKIKVAADIKCPIPISKVTATLEGDNEIEMSFDAGQWIVEYPISEVKPDKNDYSFIIRATAINKGEATNTHRVWVETPINVTGYINTRNNDALLFLDEDNELKAITTKYASNATVNVLGERLRMTLESDDGLIKTWKAKKFVDTSVGETSGIAKFKATTPNGKSDSDDVDYKTVLPLRITGNVEPTPVWAGYWVTITAETDGYAQEVELTFKGGADTGESYQMTPLSDTSNKKNKWQVKYQTWKFEPDGPIPVDLQAKRNAKTESTIVNIIIKDSYLQHRKSTVKD